MAEEPRGHADWGVTPQTHRKTVVQIYLGLRLLFIIASSSVLLALGNGIRAFPALTPGGLEQLWQAVGLFSVWSLLLSLVLIPALRSQALARADRFILMSILPDALVIYLAAMATGGALSPIYHSIYFLIAIHSYHLGLPGDINEATSRRSLQARYITSSILPSVGTAFLLYLFLAKQALGAFEGFLELGLQLITATSFSWLGLKENLRSSDLATRERRLQEQDTSLELARVNLENIQAELTKAEQDREASRGQQERMLLALGRVTNIAEMRDEVSLDTGLRQLAEKIGLTLDVEYCAIGFAYEKTVEDVAIWTRFELTDHARELLNSARINPLEGSFIGSVLLSRRRTSLRWNESDGDPLDAANPTLRANQLGINAVAAEAYRKILPGGRVRQMLLVPFYSVQPTGQPLGYIHLINRQTTGGNSDSQDFTQLQADRLATIASLLAIAIENYRNHQRSLEEREDERFLSMFASEATERHPFRDQLQYLNEKLPSRVASLWLPVVDGFGATVESRKLVLATVVVSLDQRGKLDNETLERELQMQGRHLQTQSYVGNLIARKPDLNIYYEPDLSKHEHCWTQFLAEIGTPRLLVVPIQDPMARSDETVVPEESLLAVLCLRPVQEDFQLTAAYQERVLRHAQHIQQTILDRRLKRRFQQIQKLQQGLDTLSVDNQEVFYRGLVDLVKDIMGAEACSLFLAGRETGKLFLKATTASWAYIDEEGGGRRRVETEALLGQAVYTDKDDNVTSSAFFRLGQAVLISDTNDLALSRRNFLEEIPTSKHRSLIAAPMIGSQGENYGILRCINLQEGFRILPGFLPSDLKFFKLVASVLVRFIEIAQLASRRRRFMREMAHEFATPLLQAETNTAFLNLILTGRQTAKDPTQVIGSLQGNISHLQALTRNIQYNVRPNTDFEASFKFNSPVDLHGLIEQIRKPMLSLARSRAIEIRGKTSQLPNLYVDRDRLAQVFYNLLYNAVKYSPHGSREIWIAHDVLDDKVKDCQNTRWHRISVSNYGIGVPKGEEERIFEEYVRGSNTQYIRQGQSGSGLGLTISRRIVQRHGGILRLEKNDNPTIFSVLLPTTLEDRGPSHDDSLDRR